MVRSIRGAITVENNDREEILQAAGELMQDIINENNLKTDDMVNMIFTLTPDLNAVFPAVAARLAGITNVPLMCMSEVDVPGALEKCVRLMITVNSDKSLDEIHHVYKREAVKLRPDLVNKK